MSRDITFVTFAGAVEQPMGQQRYELEVLRALTERNATQSTQEWKFSTIEVTGLRGKRPGVVSVPMRALSWDSASPARGIGRVIYRKATHIHRFDLRLPPPAVPEVVTVHDLPPLRFSDEGHMPGWTLRSAERARAVICPSQFAADEIRNLTGVTEVHVIPNGVGAAFFPTCLSPALPKLTGHPPYVLHVGGATTRKNLAGLAGAWRLVQHELPDLRLLLVGPPDSQRDEAFRGIDVVKLGYKDAMAIADLMREARLVVVPSTYEGFGLPALEAMAVGAPVVAARRGALPEVCGLAAMLVEPDAESLADGIVKVASDDRLRAELTARGRARAAEFSWARSAEGHLEAYRRAFDG